MKKVLRVLSRQIIIVVVAFLVLTPIFGANPNDKSLAKMVKILLDNAPTGQKRIAVGEVTDPEKHVTAFSSYIADQIEVDLGNHAREKGFMLLDRRNTEELVKEWKLGMYGYVNSDTSAQAGKLLGVDILCLGKYIDTGKNVKVSIDLVNAESGQILGTASTEIKCDKVIKDLIKKILKTEDALDMSDSLDEKLKVELWSDRNEYKIGEKMRVYAKVNQHCYLTLIDLGTSGNVMVIFPNFYAPSNAVNSGMTYTIPDPNAGFEFEIEKPKGIDIIRAIASKEPSVDLKEVMESFSANKPFGNNIEDESLLARDIHVKAKKTKKGDWSESVLKLAIK